MRAFARSDGPYATASNREMLTAALDGLAERHGLTEPGAVGEFVAGAVLKHSRDYDLARETVLGSVLDERDLLAGNPQGCTPPAQDPPRTRTDSPRKNRTIPNLTAGNPHPRTRR
ncbi:hypothetical protein FM21_27015 [Streptomyces mutabilis]|uniref:Uncharacterized protein n=1 Tax=Streptomyces mutabilis TaxID=67332 RepID=A0A086MZT5_9ACTN|nr:hypothetical protein FM21_27015 [Streptomyces mutabilis]